MDVWNSGKHLGLNIASGGFFRDSIGIPPSGIVCILVGLVSEQSKGFLGILLLRLSQRIR